MLSVIGIWISIAWFCLTPCVFLLDSEYEFTTVQQLQCFYEEMPVLEYIPNFRDCDNFAFIYKGVADKQTNAVGIVFGRAQGTWHWWNGAMTDEGMYQIEPRTGEIFKKSEDYRPLIIII